MGYENVGKVWDIQGFVEFLKTQDLGWAKGITIHHTSTPSLAQRPKGWTIQHMRNLQHFYQKKLGWSAGPHLFTDEDQVFGLSGLHRRGVHARSFNATHIGIEVLGDYDNESPSEGRGLACWVFAASVARALLDAAGLHTDDISFHRDDPKTSKTCPGSRVDLGWFRRLVPSGIPLEIHTPVPGQEPSNQEDREDGFDPSECIEAIEWQLEKLKDGLG